MNGCSVKPEATLLGIPYTVREVIYDEILEWTGIELFFHITPTCFLEDIKVGARQIATISFASYREYRPSGFKRPACQYLSKPAHFNQVGYARRWPTFFDLLSSCRRIRMELGEMFWRRTQFKMSLTYSYETCRDINPTMIMGCLDQRFPNARIFDGIQSLCLALEFDTPEERKKRKPYRAIVERTNICLEGILKNCPNLRRVTLSFKYPDGELDAMISRGVIEVIFSTLKQASNLQTVRIMGIYPNLRKILKRWKSHLQADIKELPLEENPVRQHDLELAEDIKCYCLFSSLEIASGKISARSGVYNGGIDTFQEDPMW